MFSAAFGGLMGLGLGVTAGVSAGPAVVSRLSGPLKVQDYFSKLDQSADHRDDVGAPERGARVGAAMRKMLPFTANWTTSPDYQQVDMVNRVVAVMWPTLSQAIMAEVLKVARAQLDAQVFKKPKLGFVEDIVLGTSSMAPDGQDWSGVVDGKVFDLGSVPPRIGGIKVYNTADDEVILELPLLWGSNGKFDVGAFVRFRNIRLYVPVTLSNLSLKVDVRVTLKPLVDTIPCVGGVQVSLLRVPHVDFSLVLFKGVDLMALPIVKDAVRAGVKGVMESMFVYPNALSVPIMPNWGVPPPARGAIIVRITRAQDLPAAETYIGLEVRTGRQVTSQTKTGTANPEFNEEFNLIVDDTVAQRLKLFVYRDDMGWADPVVAVGEVEFATVVGSKVDKETRDIQAVYQDVEFIRNPMSDTVLEVKLRAPREEDGVLICGNMATRTLSSVTSTIGSVLSMPKSMLKSSSKASKAQAAPTRGAGKNNLGSIFVTVKFVPFFQPTYDDEVESEAGDEGEQSGQAAEMEVGAHDEAPVRHSKGDSLAAAVDKAVDKAAEVVHEIEAKLATAGKEISRAVNEGLHGKEGAAPTDASTAPKPTTSTQQAAFAEGAAKQGSTCKPEKSKASALPPTLRQVTHSVPPGMKGVLTVHLIRCIGLDGEDINSYVRLMVSDEAMEQVQKSRVIFSEVSPRWGDKFDFVLVPAEATLFVTVYSKPGLTGQVLSNVNIFGKKKKDEDRGKVLGRLPINIKDVARNGSLKDIWTLHDAEKGQIELGLSWTTCWAQE